MAKKETATGTVNIPQLWLTITTTATNDRIPAASAMDDALRRMREVLSAAASS